MATAKKNPFEDDDDDDKPSAAEVQVEDGDEEVTPEEVSAEPRPSRKERRAERGALHTENERLRAQQAEYEAENRRLQAQVAAREIQERQQPQGPDPLDKELETVDQDIRQLHENASANWSKWSAQEKETAQRKLRDLEYRKNNVYLDRRERERGGGQQLTAEQQAANAVRYMVRTKNPDVFADKRAYAYADAEFKKQVTVFGKPESAELMQECIDEAREVVLRGGSPSRSNGNGRSDDVKHKFTGQRGSGGAGGSKQTVVKATPELKAMARAAYPDLETAQAMQKWANEHGKRYSELMSSKGSD